MIISLNLFGPREEGSPTLVSGPGDTSISVPPSVAASGATFTIQQLDPATAPELPEWADNVISLYDFSVDRPIQDSVTIRIPIPDVELAVLSHYYDGNWEAMFFEEEDGKAVVEVENLSLFSWLDVKVSEFSDKTLDFFTLRWMEEKPSLSSDFGIDVDESGALGLLSGRARFINEDEVELLVYNNAPVHLEVYPTEYPSGKVIELKQTGIYASGDRAIIAPRSSAEWRIQLASEESVTFEAHFSDSAVVSLTGDLIPYGRFARGLVESSLFARNGREMGWGDIKRLLIIPAVAEASKTIEEIGEMPILETARIIFTRASQSESSKSILKEGFSIALSEVKQEGDIATLHFAITKVADMGSQYSKLKVTLMDDHGNNYSGILDLNIGGATPEITRLLPIGFTYVDSINISIPGQAPIETIRFDDGNQIAFKDVKFVKPTFRRDFGPVSIEPGSNVSLGKYLMFTFGDPADGFMRWILPVKIANTEYNPITTGIRIGVQFLDGKIAWTGSVNIVVQGLGETNVDLQIIALSQALEYSFPISLILHVDETSTDQKNLKIMALNPDQFPPLRERIMFHGWKWGIDRKIPTGDIYVINSDGSGKTKLSSDVAEIVTNTLNDPKVIKLLREAGYNSVWSPDGKKIVRSTSSGLGSWIYIANTDDSNKTYLTEGWDPAWSPDGTTIAFIRFLAAWQTELCTIPADGTEEPKVLVKGDSPEAPIWSPDSEKIAFHEYSEQCIYVINADGTGKVKLAYGGGYTGGGYVWSPDGKKIAFHHGGYVYVINTDGSGKTMLSEGMNPIWVPAFRVEAQPIE